MIELNVTNLVGGNIVITTSSSGGGGSEGGVSSPTIVEYENGETRSYNIVGELNSSNFVDTIYDGDEPQNAIELTIGNTVTSIETGLFNNSPIQKIVFPTSMTSINGVFGYCEQLSEVTIPSNITDIGYEEFASCNNLVNIIFQNRTYS